MCVSRHLPRCQPLLVHLWAQGLPGWVLPTKVKIEQKSKLLSSHSQILMPPKDKAVVKCVASILVGTAMNYIYCLVLYPRFTCESSALEKNKISFHQVCFKCRYYHQSNQNTVQIISKSKPSIQQLSKNLSIRQEI